MLRYLDDHETCALCNAETDFNVDVSDSGRPIVNPQGDTIKCGSCGEFICGSCKCPNEPTYCKACTSCDECFNYVPDGEAIIVKYGSYTEVAFNNGHKTERICRSCQAERLFSDAITNLTLSKDSKNVHVRMNAARDTIRLLEEYVNE